MTQWVSRPGGSNVYLPLVYLPPPPPPYPPAAFIHLSASQESHPSLSDKEWSTIAAYLPQSAMKQLADPKSKVSQRVIISREEAVRKLMELEYHSLAVALEIGWLL